MNYWYYAIDYDDLNNNKSIVKIKKPLSYGDYGMISLAYASINMGKRKSQYKSKSYSTNLREVGYESVVSSTKKWVENEYINEAFEESNLDPIQFKN